MLKQLAEIDADKAAAFAWRLLGSAENQSYPLYQSLKEVEKEFTSRALGAYSGLYGYCYANELIGVLCYFAHPEDKYLQTVAFLAAEDHTAVFAAFLSFLRESYAGFKVLIGITEENVKVADALLRFGYTLVEASEDMRLSKSRFVYGAQPGYDVERINKACFHEYAGFHDRYFGDIYWNAARLYDKADDWYIFVIRNAGKIGGSLFLTTYQNTAEIFGMTVEDMPMDSGADAFLLNALEIVFRDNASVNNVIFLVDEKYTCNLAVAKRAGFDVIGRYRCYAYVG